jgi:hypothetical protein
MDRTIEIIDSVRVLKDESLQLSCNCSITFSGLTAEDSLPTFNTRWVLRGKGLTLNITMHSCGPMHVEQLLSIVKEAKVSNISSEEWTLTIPQIWTDLGLKTSITRLSPSKISIPLQYEDVVPPQGILLVYVNSIDIALDFKCLSPKLEHEDLFEDSISTDQSLIKMLPPNSYILFDSILRVCLLGGVEKYGYLLQKQTKSKNPSLSEICPSIFNPGYLEVCSFQCSSRVYETKSLSRPFVIEMSIFQKLHIVLHQYTIVQKR